MTAAVIGATGRVGSQHPFTDGEPAVIDSRAGLI
jgi:hypothetical protein